MAREFAVSARVTLLARVEQYLTERRRVGFELKSMEPRLKRFAEHVFAINHQGALTVELMTAWARPRQLRHLGSAPGQLATLHGLASPVRSCHRDSG